MKFTLRTSKLIAAVVMALLYAAYKYYSYARWGDRRDDFLSWQGHHFDLYTASFGWVLPLLGCFVLGLIVFGVYEALSMAFEPLFRKKELTAGKNYGK